MKEKLNHYIEYLSFLHLDSHREIRSQRFMACNTQSHLPSVNRVYIPDQICSDDYNSLISNFQETPFTFWIDQQNAIGNESMQKLTYSLRCSYPLMHVDLNNLIFQLNNSSIQIKQFFSEDEILSLWAPLVVNAYGKINLNMFKKYISYLLSTTKRDSIHFYVGYYLDQPCATSMLILRDEVTDIHWVGTIPEFRNKGMGEAVTALPLLKLKDSIKEAILYASEMGRPIYEKMGFAEVSKVNVYNRFT